MRTFCIWLYILCPISYLLVWLHTLFVRRKRGYKYEVSLCLIFKNEAPYLKEWIEYHRLIGVDHFYLYNNFSDDNYREVLSRYIEQGLVTMIEWPHQYAQVAAYEDCHVRVKNETHWLGYIDADEFVNLQELNDIKLFLRKYNTYPALYLYWKMFGTSGVVKESPNYLVTESYTASWPYLCDVGKSFINNDYREFKIGIHQSTASLCHFPIFPIDDKKVFKPFFSNPLTSLCGYKPRAYINHYWSKSYEYYKYKDFQKGDADKIDNVQIRKHAGRFEWHELNNSIHDYSIQRWLVLLKNSMCKIC